ncbi:MAG: undecaprenyl-diphosphate phosphatase [Spirochaetia bacterium]|jgi:undecaprenyl-diphosphatase|nr:undecaprenyl-diphosphate phosphatase [Spirochaetia bacterium]
MTFIQSISLGALQGFTEFLPVSSSGHLAVVESFMRLQDVPVLFDILLHLATLLVIIIVFRKRLIGIVISLFKRNNIESEDKANRKLFLMILVSTFFTGIIGLGLNNLEVENYLFIIYLLFIITGIILIGSKFWGGSIDYNRLGLKQGVITGISQGLGVLPGISRSGITISAALLSGMSREKAGEYSFLISLPAILGAFILELKDAEGLLDMVDPLIIGTGMLSAFIVGLLSLKILLKLIKKGKLYLFSFYLIPLGFIGLLFFR